MTVVEDYSVEAVAEVLEVIRSRVRRGDLASRPDRPPPDPCVNSHTIRRIVEKRFGLSHYSSRFLREAVERELQARGVLVQESESFRCAGIFRIDRRALKSVL